MPKKSTRVTGTPKRVRVFVSYPVESRDLARFVSKRLQEMGVDSNDVDIEMQPGEDWRQKVKADIRNSDAVVSLITPDSVRSDWMSYELGLAAGMDRKVIPIVIDVRPESLPSPLSSRASIHLDQLDEIKGMVEER